MQFIVKQLLTHEGLMKGITIQSQFLIFVEKSILYIKITMKKIVSKLSFKYATGHFIFIVPIMSQILNNI